MNAIAAMKTQILMIELLLSFALAGLLTLCATYFTLAYYRLVSIAKYRKRNRWAFRVASRRSIFGGSSCLP